MNLQHIHHSLNQAHELLNLIMSDEDFLKTLSQSVQEMVKTLNQEGRILACGNGGSMCDSMHFVEELTGRYRKDRRPLSAISMGDPGHITCVANDYGYDHIFERHVEAWGRKGDTLLAISTSGNSKNVILATEKAKSLGIKVVGLLGKDGGALKSLVDYPLIVPHQITDRIQEIHIKLIHIMIEGIERSLFPEHYA